MKSWLRRQKSKKQTPISGEGNNFDTLEDSLDFLRVCIKYLRFDLDATRRENQYLRKLLDDLNG